MSNQWIFCEDDGGNWEILYDEQQLVMQDHQLEPDDIPAAIVLEQLLYREGKTLAGLLQERYGIEVQVGSIRQVNGVIPERRDEYDTAGE